jgi:DNA-binding MarR family transcriptional regulator
LEPAEPDWAILVVGAHGCVADRLTREIAAAGYPTRPAYGAVLRALEPRPMTLTALAERLGVTKQAVAAVVDEMVEHRYVERRPDPADRRAKRLALTRRGRSVRRTAQGISERMESELVQDLGADAVAAARTVLLRFVERHGRLEDARARRARPVW